MLAKHFTGGLSPCEVKVTFPTPKFVTTDLSDYGSDYSLSNFN